MNLSGSKQARLVALAWRDLAGFSGVNPRLITEPRFDGVRRVKSCRLGPAGAELFIKPAARGNLEKKNAERRWGGGREGRGVRKAGVAPPPRGRVTGVEVRDDANGK